MPSVSPHQSDTTQKDQARTVRRRGLGSFWEVRGMATGYRRPPSHSQSGGHWATLGSWPKARQVSGGFKLCACLPWARGVSPGTAWTHRCRPGSLYWQARQGPPPSARDRAL